MELAHSVKLSMLRREILPATTPRREYQRILSSQLWRGNGAFWRLFEIGQRIHTHIVVHVAEELDATRKRVEAEIAVEAKLAALMLVVLEFGIHDNLLAQLAERNVNGHSGHVVRAELQHFRNVIPIEQIGVHLFS